MKKIVLLGIIILMVIPGAFAQVRLDLAIEVPKAAGFNSDSGNEIFDGSVDFFKEYTLPIPSAMAAYKFGETFRLGIGAVGITGELFDSSGAFPYVFFLTGRFSILFDK